MINSVNHPTISAIFPNDRAVYYEIPKYQREYTWSKKEWGLLFNDVIENDKGYFLGSIINVSASEGNGAFNDPVLEVIDGQQRITSLSLLLLAIYSKLKEFNDILDEDQRTSLNNIKRELVYKNKDGKEKPRITPQIQNNNQADYFSLLHEQGIYSGTKIKNAGNRRIYKGYKFFLKDCVEKYIEESNKNNDKQQSINLLLDLADKFNSAVLVSIEVSTHKDAYMLFESLNNRGVPLSAIDLIKNIIISTSDKDGKADECYSTWKEILEYLGEEYSDQERFFRYYYDVYREELNKPYPTTGKTMYALGYVATKSNLLDIYEKLINNGYEAFLNNIKSEAKTYSILINNASLDDTIPLLEEPLKDLERIQGTPGYILLMYLLSNKNKLGIDDNIIKNIINYLVSFFVRRNITDFPNTRNLVKIFMDTIDIARKNTGNSIYTGIVEYLKSNSSSDAIFRDKLNGQLYVDNPDATRFLLCSYENEFRTNEIYTDLWKRDEKSGKFIWTIEHIFPEGENIPQCWIDMIAGGNKDQAHNYWECYVHTLGNLTITGYNSNLGNFAFDKKKNRQDKKGNDIGYKNGLKLNEDVANKSAWTKDDITNRTKKLVDHFATKYVL